MTSQGEYQAAGLPYQTNDIAESLGGHTLFHYVRAQSAVPPTQTNETLLGAAVVANVLLHSFLPGISCKNRRWASSELEETLRGLGIEMEHVTPQQMLHIQGLVEIGMEMRSTLSSRLPSEDVIAKYGRQVETEIHALLQNQPIADSGWAPPPDEQEQILSIRDMDPKMLNILEWIVHMVNSASEGHPDPRHEPPPHAGQ